MKSRCISFDLVTIEVIFLILFGLIVTSYAVVPKISWGADCTVENKWVFTAAGKSHSLSIKSNGTLWAWGGNKYGQLGDGTAAERHSPIQTGMEDNWTKVVAGYFHSIALKSDGTLWTWGLNEYGQLGDGTTAEKSFLVQIGPMSLSKNLQ
jgi:alpha-tubulin suppressor-like RCC1 family protein